MHAIGRREIIEISYLYYNEKKTQEEIATLLGISRFKVGRILKTAIQEGIVSITINDPISDLIEMEIALTKKYGLKKSVVVRTVAYNGETPFDQIGKAGARYLSRIATEHKILGVTWGRTLRHMINNMDAMDAGGLTIIQLSGGMGSIEGTDTNMLTMMLGQKLGAKPLFLQSPVVVKDKKTKKALLQEKSVAEILRIARKTDLALVGIGLLNRQGLLWQSGMMEERDYRGLQKAGAVGAICGRCFDINGKPCVSDWDDRVIGLTLKELKRIQHKVGIAFGKEKMKGIVGALNGRYLDVLITDEDIANSLLV
ncbi:MAG: sugar-binding transcriptional regulator [Deltaproteobacteria bacterium]|jgi:DNA-binding transcriptional regulator LsrR (DeoR family)|nr:sugar-binding transcriptional regulator [Deltaproteobacteria bacterium]